MTDASVVFRPIREPFPGPASTVTNEYNYQYNQRTGMARSSQFTTKVGPKGQSVIPKPVRDEMGIRPGDKVTYRIDEGHVILEKQDADAALQRLMELFPKTPEPDHIDWETEYAERFR